jgi:glycosyltransferase involved in cell wall biosynthesis
MIAVKEPDMNILLFARSFHGMPGGIEKMSLIIAQGLSARGHKVKVVSLDTETAQPFYPWPEHVSWTKIAIGDSNNKASIRVRLRRALKLRRVVKDSKIDVAIGFQIGSFALLRFALCGLGVKVIAAERNAPTLYDYIRLGRIKRFISFVTLLSAYKIAIQFHEYERYYPNWLSRKLAYTPNPVVAPEQPQPRGRHRSDLVQLLFVGRLTYQKNLEVLIEALRLLNFKAQLTVIGCGPDLISCKRKATQLDLDVRFIDPVKNPYEYMFTSDFLVLPSRWEGFPNVVAEALSVGLPVVGFEKCAGVSELVKTGVNGYVCLGEMSAKNLALGITEATAIVFQPDTIRRTVSPYSYENCIDHWERVIR